MAKLFAFFVKYCRRCDGFYNSIFGHSCPGRNKLHGASRRRKEKSKRGR